MIVRVVRLKVMINVVNIKLKALKNFADNACLINVRNVEIWINIVLNVEDRTVMSALNVLKMIFVKEIQKIIVSVQSVNSVMENVAIVNPLIVFVILVRNVLVPSATLAIFLIVTNVPSVQAVVTHYVERVNHLIVKNVLLVRIA